MSGGAHTKGPWRFRDGYIEHQNANGFWQPIKLYSPWVERAWAGDAEAEANALVASAAPDMLEALELIRDGLSGYAETQTVRGDLFKIADAAIQKARPTPLEDA